MTSILLLGPSLAQVGAPLQVAAFAQYANLTSADITATATWTSSNTQIASFTTLGGLPLLQVFRTGTVTITAAFGGRSATLNITVV